MNGRINLRQTIDSLNIDESWAISEDVINADYAREVCSKNTRKTKKMFRVSNPASASGIITITRLS